MTITDLPPTDLRAPALETGLDEIQVVPDRQRSSAWPPPTDPSERSYIRKVVTAWLLGIPVFSALITMAVLAVGDLGVGGSVAVGLFGGFWMAPLAGVAGIGVWASEQSHR